MVNHEHFSVLPFSSESFFRLIEDRPEANFAQTSYLFDYLKKLEAESIIVEESYVDRDYLLDYTNYFSRSYDAPPRYTTRIHFSTLKFNEDTFTKYFIKSSSGKFFSVFQEGYLGFVIKRPLVSAPLGRTLLVPPKSEQVQDSSITFPALTRHYVHLFGTELSIRSLPFQQQDEAVVKCASTAIWSTLNKLGDLFDINTQFSPAEVRSQAMQTIKGYHKLYPAAGLNVLQTIDFFQSLGLEVDHKDFTKDVPPGLLEHIYAYINLGIPSLAYISLQGGNYSDEGSKHVFSIVGYELENDSSVLDKANRIKTLYVHDDAVGPYSEVVVDPEEPKFFDCSWNKNDGYGIAAYDEVTVEGLITPVYRKIRLPLVAVHDYLLESDGNGKDVITGEQRDYFDDFSLYLTTLVNYKEEVSKFNADRMVEILTENKPRFLWLARLEKDHEKKKEVRDYLFDATHHCNPRSVHLAFLDSYKYFEKTS